MKLLFLSLWELAKFLMSVLKRQVSFHSDFASFFIAMTHHSSSNLKVIHFLLLIKGSHQSPNFETFEWPVENLPNSLCHFPNHRSDFLQILHHSPVPWKITPLYFFRSNVIYFARKEPIKVQIFETFECSDQSSPTSCSLWNNKLLFLQILHYSSFSKDITLLYFFSWKFIYFQQKEPIKVKIW